LGVAKPIAALLVVSRQETPG